MTQTMALKPERKGPAEPQGAATQTDPEPPRRSFVDRGSFVALSGAIVCLLAVLAQLDWLRIGFVGWDTYPVIATSRVTGFGDLFGFFGRELMDGLYQKPYYRPVLNLSLAVDYHLWGLDAIGFQATTLAIFTASALCVALLTRRMLGEGATFGPLLAGALFALHPVHADILPVIARRPESLSALFLLVAILLHLRPEKLLMGKVPILPALFGGLAMLSKEPALVYPALAFGAVAFFSPRALFSARLKQAWRNTLPDFAVFGAVIGARFLVLGSVGGPEGMGPRPGRTGELLGQVAFPQMEPSLLFDGTYVFAAAVAAVIGAGGWIVVRGLWHESRDPHRGLDPGDHVRRAASLAFGAWWLIVMALVHGLAGPVQPWYGLLPLVGLALAFGALADLFVAFLRSRVQAAKAVGSVGFAASLLFLTWQSWYSPLFVDYGEWKAADRELSASIERLDRLVEEAEDGVRLRLKSVPKSVRPREEAPSLAGVQILTNRSIEGWARLRFPLRTISVTFGPSKRKPEPHELVLHIDGFEQVELP